MMTEKRRISAYMEENPTVELSVYEEAKLEGNPEPRPMSHGEETRYVMTQKRLSEGAWRQIKKSRRGK